MRKFAHSGHPDTDNDCLPMLGCTMNNYWPPSDRPLLTSSMGDQNFLRFLSLATEIHSGAAS
jgi:hypothetical protein